MKTASPIPPPAEVSTTANPANGGLPAQPAGGSLLDRRSWNRLDLTGHVFGRLTAIAPAQNITYSRNNRTKSRWRCRCACGNYTEVVTENLRCGNTTSCGCAAHEIVDKTGERFGKLTVIRQAPSKIAASGKRTIYWECKCDCGAVVLIRSRALNAPYGTKSCGCLTKARTTAAHLKDLTGRTFGYYTVLGRSPIKRYGEVHWTCRCRCGTIKDVSGHALRRGNTKSCGCYKLELRRYLCQERHPRWDPTTPLAARQLKRKSAVHLGLMAKRRDNWTCQCCGVVGPHLIAHHIEAWHTSLGLRLDPANLISLCRNCHAEYHYIYGDTDANLEDLNEFLSHLKPTRRTKQ